MFNTLTSLTFNRIFITATTKTYAPLIINASGVSVVYPILRRLMIHSMAPSSWGKLNGIISFTACDHWSMLNKELAYNFCKRRHGQAAKVAAFHSSLGIRQHDVFIRRAVYRSIAPECDYSLATKLHKSRRHIRSH